jgi:NADH-quinone oxidoreductase subunit F
MKTIKIGLGTCGVSAGGEKVYTALKEGIARENIAVNLLETGCMGNCYNEVLLEIIDEKGNDYLYGNVTPDKVKRILDEQIRQDKPIEEWIVKGLKTENEDTFFAKQKRIVLRHTKSTERIHT